jgi:rod shape-determining protein MreC
MKTLDHNLQTIIMVLIGVGLIALALGGFLTPISRLLVNPFVSAQYWITQRYQAMRDLVTAPQDLTRLRQQNQELQAEVSNLQAQIIQLQQQLSETKILSALVDFARASPENRYQAAAVIGQDPSPFLNYVIINRGSDDGLKRGMPVVTQQGLVGRIDSVTASASRVQLITDPDSIVNVRFEPSQVEAVLSGELTGDITLDMIPQGKNVKTGDLVLTSGLGGAFPSNILIGQIAGIRSRDQDLFQTGTIQTVVDFSKLEIVLVITNFKPIDTSPLIPTAEGQ